MTDPASTSAPPQTPLHRRTADLGRLASTTWDVVIVGGGIVGAGALLDATTRGLKAALIEQDDIASGTSSRSSRLIHGGLRYLEQFHVGLVREALAERSRLLRNAPHLVTLEPLLFPIYGIPFLHKAFYDAGLTLYDLLGARHDGGWHRRLSVADTLAIAPSLRRPGLRGGLLYHDGMEDDARFTLAVVRTALASEPTSLALTRVRATGVREGHPGLVETLLARNLVTGSDIEIRTSAVVDATGVWAADPGHPFAGPSLRILPSRGAHLVVPRSRIPSTAGLTIRVPGKIVFLVPWPDHWLIGTTDAPYDGRPDRPAADRWEIDQLLATVNATLDVDLTRADIVGTYAGLRPLVAPSGGSTVKASREHRVTIELNGVVRIGGGKYTT
ncbi:MAG: glycerol-3-phosphate dehydrogenase/oxidase, partial [Candidatus Limnocylindrales bacterium]